jgi:hypothetical protein
MTLDEYLACRLPKRLSFREREAALLVLVHDMSPADAAVAVGFNPVNDLAKVVAVVSMFQQAHAENL